VEVPLSEILGKSVRVERELGGKTLVIEAGKMGLQAHGSVTVQYEGTMVMVNAVYGAPRPGFGGDFFPLTMDYRERFYAAGKFPGGFRKREGAPNNKEILTSRLMDRPHRPLFPEHYRDEVQVMAQTLGADGQNDPDMLAMIGASASLFISEIPITAAVASIRIAEHDGEFIVMPTTKELTDSRLTLVVSSTRDAVMMIEGDAAELPEEEVLKAILFAHEQAQIVLDMQEELREKCGKQKIDVPDAVIDTDLAEAVRAKAFDRLLAVDTSLPKKERAAAQDAIKDEVLAELAPDQEDTDKIKAVKSAFESIFNQVVRKRIMNGSRADGRTLDEVREIACEVGVIPRVHGSALFRRGETQALVIATLGTADDEQKVDGLGDVYYQHFMLHYNFPPFCVGETRMIRGPGRREIGHGALAERSLDAIIPSKDDFPYTVRLVSEIVSSNGSSSQASVCAGTLALMDAGVPISNPVAGISIGLVLEADGSYKLLTDIAGEEDHYGDMDFKVAGTQRGITGIQLDIKVAGITEAIIREALQAAKDARISILKNMLQTISRPREALSEFAPRLLKVQINPERIGAVIGPGGNVIRGIQDETGAKIEISDDGTVLISSRDMHGVEKARDIVLGLAEQVEVGRVYDGEVVGIKDFGVFVQILPGQDGMVHVSEWSNEYVDDLSKEAKIGQKTKVKVIGVDDHNRVRLSRKAVLIEENAG